MIKGTIPAKVVIECDRCGGSGVPQEDGPFQNAGMHVKQAEIWGRGHDGAIGGARIDYDFCEACTNSFHDWRQDRGLAIAKSIATMLGKRVSDCADPEHHDSIHSAIQELETYFGLKEGALEGVWVVYKDAYDRGSR